MSDDEYDTHCPLCVEEMDLSDQNFLPCPCGYKVCMWCWHHIRENLNGLCPACRTPYNSDPHAFSAVDREDVVKLKKEKKQKEKQEKKVGDRVVVAAPGIKPVGASLLDRKHLHNYRVVQRNLVYVIGVPACYAFEETLRRPEFFGQYGKIGKVVIHRNPASAHTTVSVYVTFVHREDAKASIQSLDGHWLDQTHILRASFGTTKYCNNFIRGVPCNNPDCVYLHDLGDDDDRFTKEEIQAGHSKIAPVPGQNQTLVTGNGGPSGTGKRPTGEPVLPPPVFIQDNNPTAPAGASAVAGATPAAAVPAPTPIVIGSGVGVGIVTGRPAAVSRSGTATWGNPSALAAITGNASSAADTSTAAALSVAGPAPGLVSEKRGGGEDEFPRAGTPTTPATAPVAASAPTAALKRNASSTSNNASAATTTTAPATSTAAPAATAPDAASNAPASTPATAPAVSGSEPAPVAPAKVKPKTAKEIAAEKRAALAAAKAAAQAPVTAPTPVASAATVAPASSDPTTPEVEAKPSGPVPTPKLSARQQMLQNKADKAAARAAAAAERAAEKSAAAQEKANAAAALKEASNAASASTATSQQDGGEVTLPSTATAAKVSAIIKRPDSKNKLNSAASASPVPAVPAPASAVSSSAPSDTSELPPLQLPASATGFQSPSLLSWGESPSPLTRFNGLSANAVFPVPLSSLHCSVWANILRASNEDLSMNPYGQLTTPLCELLDLTLPPGDALSSATPTWPRPMSYYTTGMTSDGITSTPAGKHNHLRSVVDMATLPSLPPLPPPSLQPRSDAVFQPGTKQPSTPVVGAPPSLPAPAPAPAATPTVVPATASTAKATAAANRPEGSVERFAREAREKAAATGAPPPAPTPPGGNASMNALRQLFPGVKMSVSGAAQGAK